MANEANAVLLHEGTIFKWLGLLSTPFSPEVKWDTQQEGMLCKKRHRWRESCKKEAAWGWKMPFLDFSIPSTLLTEQGLEETQKRRLWGRALSSVWRAAARWGGEGWRGIKEHQDPLHSCQTSVWLFVPPRLLKSQQFFLWKGKFAKHREWKKNTALGHRAACHTFPTPAETIQYHMQHTYFPSGLSKTLFLS